MPCQPQQKLWPGNALLRSGLAEPPLRRSV